MKIYHNPRCSKSRQTLEILKENNAEPNIIEYLRQPPSPAELKEIINKLKLGIRDIIRSNESEYAELELGNIERTEAEIIAILCQYPKLIERPIVVNGDQACIGRPPENVLKIL